MDFPWRDPQFWLATGAFIFAALWLLRGVLPLPVLSRRRARRKRERRVTLTVGGKSVKK